MADITVLGTGFAALTAVRKLRAVDKQATITVVSPKAEFNYLPSLIWLPSGQRQPEDITLDLKNFFKRMNVTHVQASAEGLGEGGRIVRTSAGDISNDGLIIATGGQFIKILPGIENALIPCEGAGPVMEFKKRLDAMDSGTLAFGFSGNPKEKSAMRGGPMFEFLFGTDQLLRKQGRRDKFNIVFFSPAPTPGDRLGPKARKKLMQRMDDLNITAHIGKKMVRFEPGKVVTQGVEFDADLILFIPGMTGNAWFNNTDLPRSEGGLVKANRHCQVDGFERTYVVGDSGSFPGPDWQPKQAHMADLQAATAATNLLAELRGTPVTETFRVELMCVIDDNKSGILVTRTPKFGFALPPMRLAHKTKEILEKMYLRHYR